MALAGDNLGSWHHAVTVRRMAQLSGNAFDTVWQFHEDTHCIHGDCHLQNVVSSSLHEQKASLKLVDFERSFPVKEVRVFLKEDMYLPLRLVDVLHLVRNFFNERIQKELQTSPELLRNHMTIWKCFGDKIVPHCRLLRESSSLRKAFMDLFCTLPPMTCEQKYLSIIEGHHDQVEFILQGKWWCAPLPNGHPMSFLEAIIFSQHNERVRQKKEFPYHSVA